MSNNTLRFLPVSTGTLPRQQPAWIPSAAWLQIMFLRTYKEGQEDPSSVWGHQCGNLQPISTNGKTLGSPNAVHRLFCPGSLKGERPCPEMPPHICVGSKSDQIPGGKSIPAIKQTDAISGTLRNASLMQKSFPRHKLCHSLGNPLLQSPTAAPGLAPSSPC